MKALTNEFWIERQLNQIPDPERRDFLRPQFAGDEGWQKFLTLMRSRTGADEFRNGIWPVNFPKYTEAELALKHRPCIHGCGVQVALVVSEWGEVAEELPSVCPTCQMKFNNQSMENQNTQSGSATSAEITTPTKPAAVPPQPQRTIEEDLAQWPNLTVVDKIKLGERIANESRELLKTERTALEMKLKELNEQIGQVAPSDTKRGVGRPPKHRDAVTA